MSDEKPTVIVKQQKKMGCFGVIGVLVVVGVVVGMCNIGNKSTSRSSSSSTTSRTTQTQQYSLDIRPDSQKKLEEVCATYSKEFSNAANELQESTIRENRRKALQQLNIKNASDWIGTLSDMTTTTEGTAHIEITLNNELKVSNWNNRLSDSGANTLIPMDSALYKKLTDMNKGAKVRFSGVFFPNDSKDFIKEKSLTIRGAMKSSDFLVKFDDVNLLSNTPITTADVNLREGPSAETEKIMTINKGSEIKLLSNASDDGWIKISFEDTVGYINKQYLTY